jgi:hypothetical protein
MDDKMRLKMEEMAMEWVKKDDGSLGHCPDCFKSGFHAAHDLLSVELEKLTTEKNILVLEKSYHWEGASMHFEGEIVRLKELAQELNIYAKHDIVECDHLSECACGLTELRKGLK